MEGRISTWNEESALGTKNQYGMKNQHARVRPAHATRVICSANNVHPIGLAQLASRPPARTAINNARLLLFTLKFGSDNWFVFLNKLGEIMSRFIFAPGLPLRRCRLEEAESRHLKITPENLLFQ